MKFSPLNLVKSLMAAGLLFAAAQAPAQQVLRVSAIPDEAPTELQRKFKPLGEYLEKKLNMKVEFTPVTDYAASVEGLINHKLDMVWFGGFTFVQAKDRSKGQVVPLVQRAEDEKFRSVFVTTNKSINKLDDLKGKTLSFGSESSTSGHLMPRSFLLAAKINPDTDMKRIAFSGAHDATVAAVAGGKVDAGALNISVWEAGGREEGRPERRARVLHHAGLLRLQLDRARRHAGGNEKKITEAFLALDPSKPEDKAILDLQRASKFIPTKAENYTAIEAAAVNAGLLKK